MTNEVLHAKSEAPTARAPRTIPTGNDDDEEDDDNADQQDAPQADQAEGRHGDHTTDGDADDQNTVEKPEPESPPRLPDTFYYDADEINAKAISTNEKTFPQNTLSL